MIPFFTLFLCSEMEAFFSSARVPLKTQHIEFQEYFTRHQDEKTIDVTLTTLKQYQSQPSTTKSTVNVIHTKTIHQPIQE